ncbi:MAG: hypothetical protein AAF969_11320, partial [Bacteroidota bacterium]
YKFKIFSVQTSSKAMLLIAILFTNVFGNISLLSNWEGLGLEYKITLTALFIMVVIVQLVVFIRLLRKKK